MDCWLVARPAHSPSIELLSLVPEKISDLQPDYAHASSISYSISGCTVTAGMPRQMPGE
jgi:hypothetical protein